MASSTDLTTKISSPLCKNNCGFFGNSFFDGYCSRCYTEKSEKQDKSVIESEIKSLSSPPVDNLSLPTQSKSTMKKTRCPNCKKQMGILQYPCTCGGLFCSNCRYSNEHQCPIDYKAIGKKFLAKANPQVIADRVHNRQ